MWQVTPARCGSCLRPVSRHGRTQLEHPGEPRLTAAAQRAKVLRHAVREWCLLKYAALASQPQARLRDLFLRRHQLAMALLAARHHPPATPDTSYTAGTNGTKRNGARAAACNGGAPSDGSKHDGAPPDGARTAERSSAKYGLRAAETVEQWLQRLCNELPTLQPVGVSRLDEKATLASGSPTFSVPKVVLPARPELLLSQRAAFQAGLSYEEFVAVIGVQLLLSSGALGTRTAFRQGTASLEDARERASKRPPGLFPVPQLLHVLLACEVRFSVHTGASDISGADAMASLVRSAVSVPGIGRGGSRLHSDSGAYNSSTNVFRSAVPSHLLDASKLACTRHVTSCRGQGRAR